MFYLKNFFKKIKIKYKEDVNHHKKSLLISMIIYYLLHILKNFIPIILMKG